jgi:3-hydroxyacyl-CoA dehydrogenase
VHVARNVYDAAPEDESRDVFRPPAYLTAMVEKGLLGRKSGGGFYKKLKGNKSEIQTLDLTSLAYREKRKAAFPELEALKSIENPAARLKALVSGTTKASQFVWKVLAATFVYSARRLGEIAEDASSVDRAIRWGFNWTLGPFELVGRAGLP